jgi:hypothetical protein
MRYREKREESVLLHLAEVEEITSLTSVKRMPPLFVTSLIFHEVRNDVKLEFALDSKMRHGMS